MLRKDDAKVSLGREVSPDKHPCLTLDRVEISDASLLVC